jgi:hypothetical protein
VVLANSDRVLGGEAKLVQGPDGQWHAVETKGLVGRATEDVVRDPLMLALRYLLPVVVVGLAGWMGLKLWHTYRMGRFERSVRQTA